MTILGSTGVVRQKVTLARLTQQPAYNGDPQRKERNRPIDLLTLQVARRAPTHPNRTIPLLQGRRSGRGTSALRALEVINILYVIGDGFSPF
jgi:hypothetical protein